jgi:hypothetical protein
MLWSVLPSVRSECGESASRTRAVTRPARGSRKDSAFRQRVFRGVPICFLWWTVRGQVLLRSIRRCRSPRTGGAMAGSGRGNGSECSRGKIGRSTVCEPKIGQHSAHAVIDSRRPWSRPPSCSASRSRRCRYEREMHRLRAASVLLPLCSRTALTASLIL